MKTLTRIACTEEDILAVKKLDDRIFSGFHGIEIEELLAIQKDGAVLMLETPQGELIGESQILYSPIPYLSYDFSEDTAFLYGTGIAPEYQGCGFGSLLANQQERLARIQKKKELHLTVRVENYSSLKMRMREGFRIISYDPFFYGSNQPEDARLFMVKKLTEMPSEHKAPETFHVAVDFSSSFDPAVHCRIAALCDAGCIGYKIDRTGIFFRKP